MKHVIKKWNDITKRLRHKTILLFLDFDGTLTPIVSTPSKAHLSSQTRNILKKLQTLPDVKLIIISGRSLEDIRQRAGLPGIIYAGNHGCRISGAGIDWKHDFPVAWHRKLQKLHKELLVATNEIRGVLIEDKNMSIAVHYRNVANKDMASFREALAKASRPHIASLLIKPSIGKKVIELGLVTAWNKGKAVNWLIQRLKRSKIIQSYVPIYIGDDVTDETAFTTLKHKGITIHVGRGKRSAASYYLRNPPEVAIFLRKLTELL